MVELVGNGEPSSTATSSFCKLLAESNSSIIIATLLDGTSAKDWFVKPGIPIPNKKRSEIMSVQASLLCSMVNTNHDYLGKLYHIIVRQEVADIMLYPLSKKQILCLVIKRPYNSDGMIEHVNEFVAKHWKKE